MRFFTLTPDGKLTSGVAVQPSVADDVLLVWKDGKRRGVRINAKAAELEGVLRAAEIGIHVDEQNVPTQADLVTSDVFFPQKNPSSYATFFVAVAGEAVPAHEAFVLRHPDGRDEWSPLEPRQWKPEPGTPEDGGESVFRLYLDSGHAPMRFRWDAARDYVVEHLIDHEPEAMTFAAYLKKVEEYWADVGQPRLF